MNIIREFTSNLNGEFLAIVFAMFSLLFAIISLLLFKKRETIYNEKLNRIELDFMRSNYENKIYELNEKLTFEKKRWLDNNHFFANMPNDDRKIGAINQAINPYFFLENMGLNPDTLSIKPKSVFILTPFNDRYLNDYKAIEQACINIGKIGRAHV